MAGLLMFLWRLVSAPAEMHTDQASQVEKLASKCDQLEGARIILSEDLKLDDLKQKSSKHGDDSGFLTSISLRCLREIPGPFSLEVLATTIATSGSAYLAMPIAQSGSEEKIRHCGQEALFKLLDHRRCKFIFEGPLELPGSSIRGALVTLKVGSREPMEFREIQIAAEPKPPPDPRPTTASERSPPSSPE